LRESGTIGIMDQIQEQMEKLQVKGSNANKLLKTLSTSLENIRVAKMGGLKPDDKWVAPLSASQNVVWDSKRLSLNAKRRVGDQVDRVLLEFTRLQAIIIASQQASFKHAYNKQLRANADADAVDDAEDRRARQNAKIEEAVKRSETKTSRKRRRVIVDEFDGEDDSDFDLA
jgi:hypothetical protein